MTANNHEYRIRDQAFPVWKNKKGYPCVAMKIDGKTRAFLLHKLVWEAANGPVPDGHDLHHVDLNKGNWTLGNLKAVDRNAHQQYHRGLRSTDKNNKAGRSEGDEMNPKHRPENNNP